MGFRTVVVLNNDYTHEWECDPLLGEKITQAAAYRRRVDGPRFEYGQVVECVHADTQSVVLLNMYGGDAVAWDRWQPGETNDDFNLKMLKTFAEELGYKVSKKPTKKDSK